MIRTEPAAGHNSIDDEEAASYVARIESCQERIDAENADKSEIFKEIKAKGYHVEAFRIVLKERADARKGKTAKIEENHALADLIRAALARKGA